MLLQPFPAVDLYLPGHCIEIAGGYFIIEICEYLDLKLDHIASEHDVLSFCVIFYYQFNYMETVRVKYRTMAESIYIYIQRHMAWRRRWDRIADITKGDRV